MSYSLNCWMMLYLLMASVDGLAIARISSVILESVYWKIVQYSIGSIKVHIYRQV